MAWVRLPGSANRYRDTETGEELSRRQFDRRYGSLAQQGFTSYEQRQRISEQLREKGGAAKSVANERGLSRETRNIRESWKRQSEKYGLEARIRGNREYQAWKTEIQDIERWYQQQSKKAALSSERAELQREYKQQRLDTYLKFGLISQGDYDKYMGA
jgi:hypothetical protein